MSPIFSMKCRLLKKLGFMSAKCHIIRPRNVASIVHKMSSTQKQWLLSCIGWLPLEFVQDSYHWDMYRLVTIGICIGWLPQGIVYRLVTIVYDLVTSGICIGWLLLGFVQVGYHCNLYSIFSSVYRLVLGSLLQCRLIDRELAEAVLEIALMEE